MPLFDSRPISTSLTDDGDLVVGNDGRLSKSINPTSNTSIALSIGSLVDENTPESVSGFHYAGNFGVTIQDENDYNNITGLYGTVVNNTEGTIGAIRGLDFLGRTYDGTVEDMISFRANAEAFTGSVVDNMIGGQINMTLTNADVETLTGFEINQSVLTQNPDYVYGLRVGTSGTPNVRGRGIQCTSTLPSEFRGSIGISSNAFFTANPAAPLHISGSTSPQIRLENGSGFTFDFKNDGFNNNTIYTGNPFGSFLARDILTLDCGSATTGSKLLVIKNGGTQVAYVDHEGNFYGKSWNDI